MKKRGARVRAGSLFKDVLDRFGEAVERQRGNQWPSQKYRDDPVGFVREQLGEEPLPHQVTILESARDNFKVAVRSGQKTGKTKLVIWLALWWYCTHPKGRVFMVAAIKEQVKRVLWKELKDTVRTAKEKFGFIFEEDIPVNPESGIVAADGREMRGITVREVEAMAGLSGDILFIVDEASHMVERIAQAIEGNCAGGGKMIWISNPTRTDGPFYDVFNNPDKGKFWTTFHLSSEDVAEWCWKHKKKIPGVATRQRIREWEQEWGRDHPFFIVRVLGDFLRNETGRIISLGDIEVSQASWQDVSEEGLLSIGGDPAGPGYGGDKFGFCAARGKKVLYINGKLGLTEDAAVVEILSLLHLYRRGDEIPRVILDIEGPIGSALGYRLAAMSEELKRTKPMESFEFIGIKASHNARREPQIYDKLRDEVWANGAKWVRDGGALPPDHELATELHAPMWIGTLNGKLKATPKEELREVLGRSPDKADAFLMAVWEPTHYMQEDVKAPPPDRIGASSKYEQAGGPMNPYATAFDPYR